MSTRKNSLVLLSVRIGFFPIFLIVPFRCITEVLEGITDIMCLFRGASQKVFAGLDAAENALMLVQSCGPLDVVDVDVKSPEARVKVKVLLR